MSKDGQWYWKSDTSSDELDGHSFFYPLYYDLVCETEAERSRVREHMRALMDHIVSHGFFLVDHDGKPTRWAVYNPEILNHNPLWAESRGLKSLSLLSYLAATEHVTGDPKYRQILNMLREKHAYDRTIRSSLWMNAFSTSGTVIPLNWTPAAAATVSPPGPCFCCRTTWDCTTDSSSSA
ncbi:MAG: hypothetical protein WCT12_33495 [Verrucomicrobiota bacterium]